MGKDLESSQIDMWKESVDTSISSFLGVLSDVIHVFILVRFLTQQQVGLFFICYAFLYLFSQIPRGFGIAIRKRASEVNEGRSVYMWSGLILIVPTLLFVFLLFLILQPVLVRYASIDIPTNVLVSFYFATFGFSILEFSRYYVAGCGNPALAERLRTRIAKTTMPVITVLFLLQNAEVSFALYAVFISYFATSVFIFAYSDYQLILPDKDILRGILIFSKWSIITSLLNDFYRRFDTIMLGALVGTVTVSYYDSSLRIAFLSTTLAVGTSKTSNVKMSGMVEVGEDIVNLASKTFVASALLSIPLLIISIFSGEYILSTLFGQQYVDATPYLILLVIVEIFQGYRLQFESIFNSYDTPHYTTKTSLVSVVANIITAPVLVIQFGGLGVLYSTIFAEIVRVVIYQRQLKLTLNQYILPMGCLVQYFVALIVGLGIAALGLVLNLCDFWNLILSFMMSTLVFYSTLYLVSKRFKEIVMQYKETNGFINI